MRQFESFIGVIILVTVIAQVHAHDDDNYSSASATSASDSPLERLKHDISAIASLNPEAFEPEDLEEFMADSGAMAASRFLAQRSGNAYRAVRLAQQVLKWRHQFQVSRLSAGQFPCDLFKMGLIFEEGEAQVGGETSPVIWMRLGAIGKIIKQLERATPLRALSFVANAPSSVYRGVRNTIRDMRERRTARRQVMRKPLSAHAQRRADRKSQRKSRRAARHERRQARKAASRARRRSDSIRTAAAGASENQNVRHLFNSITWWLNNWARNNPDTQATLVLDFENTDFVLSSWTAGEYLTQLDDLFPQLFSQILGFRYKPKLWSMHSPISMFNRIFMSRVSSSPETDAKLKFVASEPKMSAYMPRVDAQGFSTLPEYVSGVCVAPDESKAPAGCGAQLVATPGGLYDPNFWQAANNQFYYDCKSKARVV